MSFSYKAMKNKYNLISDVGRPGSLSLYLKIGQILRNTEILGARLLYDDDIFHFPLRLSLIFSDADELAGAVYTTHL